eukprot:11196395-Ditylum_brightwellii.AAC.1
MPRSKVPSRQMRSLGSMTIAERKRMLGTRSGITSVTYLRANIGPGLVGSDGMLADPLTGTSDCHNNRRTFAIQLPNKNPAHQSDGQYNGKKATVG